MPGVIDTLQHGFSTVHRLPWVLGIPLAIDGLLWLGPRLSVTQLSGRLVDQLAAMARSVPDAQSQLQGVEAQVALLRGAGESFNVLSLLAFGGFAMHSAVPSAAGGRGGTLELQSGPLALIAALGLALVGALMAAFWLGAIAQGVRGEPPSLARLVVAAPRYWLAIVGFFAIALGIVVGVSLPLGLVAALAQIFAPVLGTFLALFLAVAFQLLAIWALLYLFFFADAVVVSEVGPIRAAGYSVRVVAANFWSTLGFIIITWVIMSGLDVIWRALAQAPVGVALAILGNGYIESGLAAASMLFYRHRFTQLKP